MKTALKAGSIYFVEVFAIGFLLGVLRTLVVVPWVGETLAVLMELPILLGVSWLICGRILQRSLLSSGEAVVMGVSAFVLLMIAEMLMSIVLANRTLSAHLALYSERAHLLGLAGQIAFAMFPVVRTMRRRGSFRG